MYSGRGKRSRGISGISTDLNLVNQTQTPSHSSNELDSSLLQHGQNLADKVRSVTFHQAPATPVNRRKDDSSGLDESDVVVQEEVDPNKLSPYNEKVANRRSHSYSREPRSPSWQEANFNSSAMSSQSRTTVREEEEEKSSLAHSQKDLGLLDLKTVLPKQVNSKPSV